MRAGFLGLTLLPVNVVVAIVLLGICGVGYAAAAVFNQIGIAAGAALGEPTVDTLGTAWAPLTGAIFAAASAAILIGLRRFLPARRQRDHLTSRTQQTKNH